MATSVLRLKTFAASDPVDYNEVNDNYVKIDNGVKTALQGRAAHNLLDNSNFRNPVNQRGIKSGASITEYAYCLDRWMNFGSTAGTLTLSENGISFTMTNLNQRLPETIKTGTVVTASAKWNDGTIVTVTGAITRGNEWTWFTATNNGHQIGVIDMGNNKEAHFTILGGSGVVEWAALYEGSYTADTLPAYVPKGYAAELAECQLYYRRGVQAVTIGKLYTAGSIFSIHFPKMRVDNPTIQLIDIVSQGWGNVDKNNYSAAWGDSTGGESYMNFLSSVTDDIGKTIVVFYESSADM